MLLKRKGVQRIAATVLSIVVLGSGFPVGANTVTASGEKAEVSTEKHWEMRKQRAT